MTVRIGELADVLHSGLSRWKALALFVAYFDESGTHDESPVTAIGGFVGTKDAWKKFEIDLAEILRPYRDKGVHEFHMTDALAQKGQFARLEKPFVNSILWHIGKALAEAKVTAIYTGVIQDDWDALITGHPDTPEAFKAIYPKPFDLCFDETLRELAKWSAKYGDGEPIAPIFSIQDEYQGRMTAVGLSLDRSKKYAGLLSSVSFGTPESITPLQAADFAAHQIRGEIERVEYWESLADAQPTQVFETAIRGKYRHGGWFNAQALYLAVTRFIETGDI